MPDPSSHTYHRATAVAPAGSISPGYRTEDIGPPSDRSPPVRSIRSNAAAQTPPAAPGGRRIRDGITRPQIDGIRAAESMTFQVTPTPTPTPTLRSRLRLRLRLRNRLRLIWVNPRWQGHFGHFHGHREEGVGTNPRAVSPLIELELCGRYEHAGRHETKRLV